MLTMLLSGCVSSLWTGANLAYDRHHIYKKLDDYQLSLNVTKAIYKDAVFKQRGCAIDLAVFNGDILLAGHVPVPHLRQTLEDRVAVLQGYRRLFNQVSVNFINDAKVQDSWITTKIRSQIFADSRIDPNAFKIVTSDQVVYLMGDVLPEQASYVIAIARHTAGVKRVVKLLQYYHLSPHSPSSD